MLENSRFCFFIFFSLSLSFLLLLSRACSLSHPRALSRTLPRHLNPFISHSHSLFALLLSLFACTLCLRSLKFDAGWAKGKIVRVTGQLANTFAWKLHQTRLDSVPQIRYAVQCMLASFNCMENASLSSRYVYDSSSCYVSGDSFVLVSCHVQRSSSQIVIFR